MTSPSGQSRPQIPRTVWMLGFVSLLMDTSSEIIHALLPLFLTVQLGLSVAMVGLIDGVAEATASITKLFSGYISDRTGKRKPLILIGYGLAAASKPFFALAGSAPLVLGARFADRINRHLFNTGALTLLRELTTESPDNVSYQVVLGRSLRDEVRIARILKDIPRADAAMRRSIELFEILSKAHPDSAAFKYELADTLSRTGDQQRCIRALSICEEISKENPQVPEYRALKATTLIKLAMLAGRTVRSEELLIQAIAIQRELSNRDRKSVV